MNIISAPLVANQIISKRSSRLLFFFSQAWRRLTSFAITTFIIAILFLCIASFYVGTGNFSSDQFFWRFVFVALFTDYIYVALHIFRSSTQKRSLAFNPNDLTIVIACYNGEDIIEETIENAMRHVPAHQIIVVSDKSTDNTVRVAKAKGARVIVNKRNVNKAFSISGVVRFVRTKYTLILDDDTLIGKTFLPTSLLDEGYSAVAFNVMPIPTSKIVNKIQMYEYRKSMHIGKDLRGNTGTIGNVSGAIGLYRTSDLVSQAGLHSGQFGGEDQQRTALVHLYSEGKGVTYSDSLVETHAPDTLKSLFRQRAFRWNLSLPELFVLYWKVMFDLKQHYLLKVEKAYQLFLYATDPLRILLIWATFLHPLRLLVLYFFYLCLSLAVWIKVGRQDPIWVVAVYPVYTHAEMICRFIAHFYWFKIKLNYIFREKFHRLVADRNVIAEYLTVSFFIVLIWIASINQLRVTIHNVESMYSSRNAAIPTEQVMIDDDKVDSLILSSISTTSNN